jgi:hypothetical protein
MRGKTLLAFVAATLLAAQGSAQGPRPQAPERLAALWVSFQEAGEGFERSSAANDAVRLAREAGFTDERVRAMEDFLLNDARRAVELRVPSPFRYDENGRLMTGRDGALEEIVSDDLRAWAASAGMDLDMAVAQATHFQIWPLVALVHFGDDPRSVAILRQALTLDNDIAVVGAAGLLAIAGDLASLDVILRRAEAAPADLAAALALALIRFDDPKAQAEAAEILGKERYEELRSTQK